METLYIVILTDGKRVLFARSKKPAKTLRGAALYPRAFAEALRNMIVEKAIKHKMAVLAEMHPA